METPICASKLLLAPGQIPSFVTLAQDPQVPATNLGNSETALKFSYAGNQWDASFLVFRGWNHLPELQTDRDHAGSRFGSRCCPDFSSLHSGGGDGSFTSGKWIFRGEAAYVWTENNNGQNPLIQPSHLDSVLGVERPIGHGLGGDFRVQGQFLFRYYPQFLAPSQAGGGNALVASVNQQAAEMNALIQNYQDQTRPGATLRLAYSNETSGIDTDVFLMGNFLGGGYLVRPQLAYAWTDSLKTTLGVDYYGGPSDRPLGVFAPYSSVFAEARCLF